jgi:hypothetical protein
LTYLFADSAVGDEIAKLGDNIVITFEPVLASPLVLVIASLTISRQIPETLTKG